MPDETLTHRPELDELIGEIAEEYSQRLRLGEQPGVGEYIARHPQLAEAIRQILPALEIMGAVPQDAREPHSSAAPSYRALGDFEIIREVGRGGMGVVYEAEQISLKRRVALKVLPFAAVLDKRQLQRFKTEAMAAGRLHHPHIVPVYQVGCERAVHFYAMQYIEGRNVSELLDIIRRTTGQAGDSPSNLPAARPHDPDATLISGSMVASPPSPALPDTAVLNNLSTDYSTNKAKYHRTIAELGIQAAEALDYAHEHGILHRDVKPSNLMLDDECHLWVTDFGLARIEGDSGLTMSGDLLGTLRYMSPEQALGKRVIIDERTDVYSLGVTLYEMLTLRPAYDGADRAEILRKISFEDPTPLRKLDPAIPVDLETIVLTATARDPRARYETAQELAQDLQRFLDHKPILARRPSRVEHARKWVKRNRAVSALLGMLFVALTVAAASLIAVISRQEPPRDSARNPAAAANTPARSEEPPAPRAPHKGPSLPGLIPEPPLIPGVGRWQMITAKPRGVMESAVWSPDETKIALGEAGNVRIYEADSLRLLHVLVGHTGHISSVCWHPDGTRLASSSWDGTVRLWTADGIPTHQLTGHEGEVCQVAWRPDGKQLASCGADHTVRLWNDDGTPHSVLRDHQNHVFCLAYSPDGKTLATGGGDIRPPDEHGNPGDNAIRLWDVSRETVKARLEGHRMTVQCIAWHPDGEKLASGDGDFYRTTQFGNFIQPAMRVPTVRVWSKDGRPGPVLTGEFGSVWALAWQPAADTLTFGGRLGEILLWHPDESTGAEAFIPHVTGVHDFNSIVWDGAGRRVLITQRFSVGISNADGSLIANLNGIEGKEHFDSIGWSPDGQRLSNAQQVWRADGTPESVIKLSESPKADEEKWLRNIGYRFDWNPQNDSYAQATRDSVQLIDGTGGRRSLPMGKGDPRPWISDLRWSPDGRRLAAPSWNDAQVRVWDDQGTLIATLKGHRGGVHSVDWSPDSQWLATGGGDSVRLWTPDGTPGPVMTGHTDEVHPVAWSPDGQWLASSATDCTVRLWRPDGTAGPVFRGHAGGLMSLAWSPDSKRLASGGWLDGTLRVWNVETGLTEWMVLKLYPDMAVSLGPHGHILHGDNETLGAEFLYLVEQRSSAIEILTNDEFRRRYEVALLNGEIQQAKATANAGNTQQAMAVFQEAFSRRIGATPNVHIALAELARALCDTLSTNGHCDEAIHIAGDAIQWLEAFCREHPDEAQYATALRPLYLARDWACIIASTKLSGQERIDILERSIADSTRSIALEPTRQAYSHRGQAHLHLCDWENALTNFQQALEFDPNWAMTHCFLATTRLKLGQYEQAVADMNRALDLGVSDWNVFNTAAWTWATLPETRLRDPQRAVELAQQAVQLAPDVSAIWNTLGVAQYYMGDYESAIASLQKSHELAPGRHDSYDLFFLAMAHWQLGEQETAKNYYRRAVEWMQQNSPGDEALVRFRAEAEELMGMAGDSREDAPQHSNQ